jgi:hypothetical protein
VAIAQHYEPYADVPPAPFRWRLGLRPLDLAEWIEIDDHYAAEIEHKHRIMVEFADTAFRVTDHASDASEEVLELITQHLAAVGDVRVPMPDSSLHPLDAAARLVQEDLVLLVEQDGELICGGGSVCFPNRWDLESKIGRTMSEIHAPVSGLNDVLESPIDKFLERLHPERSYWRLGWGILDTDELYQPTNGTASPRPTATKPTHHHLRVERETLRRLPRTGAILFTIRTYTTALTDIASLGNGHALADAIDALPHDVADYKGLTAVSSTLANWLRQVATTSVK